MELVIPIVSLLLSALILWIINSRFPKNERFQVLFKESPTKLKQTISLLIAIFVWLGLSLALSAFPYSVFSIEQPGFITNLVGVALIIVGVITLWLAHKDHTAHLEDE